EQGDSRGAGNHRLEGDGEESRRPLWHGPGAGRRPGALAQGRADPGQAADPGAKGAEVVAAAPSNRMDGSGVRADRARHVGSRHRRDHGGSARGSLNDAGIFIAENNLAAARQKLAEARAQIGKDQAALASLFAEITALETELKRFQRFFDLIDRAHEAELAPAADLSQGTGRARTPRPSFGRDPAKAAPFLLEALALHEVLERGPLGTGQIEQIRRTAYEELLWLADDVVN